MNTLQSLLRHAVTFLVGALVAFFVSHLTAPADIAAAKDAGAALIEPLTVLAGLGGAILMRLAWPYFIKIFRLGAGETMGRSHSWLLLGCVSTAVAVGGLLPSCNPMVMGALRAVPIRGAVVTNYGTIGYSSKSGVSLLVDRRSAK